MNAKKVLSDTNIINYISSNQPFQFTPILSNSANIGKNLKVFKEVSGRVKQVDKWTRCL